MASSDTNSVDTLPTILSAYAEQTRPLQILLLIYSVLGAICFPLLLVLVHLSTARSRRTPLFVLTMVDVILGIVVASWMVSILLPPLLNPLAAPSRSVLIAIPIVGEIITWVLDLVLLLRLYAIFPLSTTPRRIFWGVLLLSVLLMAGRVGLCIADFAWWVRNVSGSPYAVLYSSTNIHFMRSPLLKLAIICDILDHAFVASCFLWRLRIQSHLPRSSTKDSYGNRIKGVFYIAVSNFVSPIVIDFTMLLFISIESLDFINILYLTPVNVYMTIFGVVFATVWSSSNEDAASIVTLHVERPSAGLVPTLSAYDAAGQSKQGYHKVIIDDLTRSKSNNRTNEVDIDAAAECDVPTRVY